MKISELWKKLKNSIIFTKSTKNLSLLKKRFIDGRNSDSNSKQFCR